MDGNTAAVSDRKGNLAILSCPNHLEGKFDLQYLCMRFLCMSSSSCFSYLSSSTNNTTPIFSQVGYGEGRVYADFTRREIEMMFLKDPRLKQHITK